MCTLNRRKSILALNYLVADIALVLDTGQLCKSTIVTVLDFLTSVQVLYVSRVLQVGTRSRVSMIVVLIILIEREIAKRERLKPALPLE